MRQTPLKRTGFRRKVKSTEAGINRKGALVMQAVRLRKKYIKRKPKPDNRTPEEKAYYEWLKEQRCLDAPWYPCEERHHIRSLKLGAGMGLKPSDFFALPISQKMHREIHNKGESAWTKKLKPFEECILFMWQKYGLDRIPEEIKLKLTL